MQDSNSATAAQVLAPGRWVDALLTRANMLTFGNAVSLPVWPLIPPCLSLRPTCSACQASLQPRQPWLMPLRAPAHGEQPKFTTQ